MSLRYQHISKLVRGFTLLQALSFASTQMAAEPPNRDKALVAMKRATAFMVDKVSCQGGYVWTYLPDFSRRWGEMEARPTMIWLQPPGTPTMGQLFLDAYHATGDEYYYRAAERTADAIIRAQLPCGGWNYVADFAGEASLREWYATVGKNGWRLEEFQHYYGNATFDDRTTSEAARFLLRLYLEKRDARYKEALDRAIKFVLDAQLPAGAWPQRFPPTDRFSKDGNPDYTAFLTFNDEVSAENIELLMLCYRALGEARLIEPIRRAMNSVVATQLPSPQAGWALQYTPDLKPAGARTYEPRAIVTHTTAQNIGQLLKFYDLTGDRKFLARIPEALDWLESVRLPPELRNVRGSHPTFVDVGSNKPLFVHRKGSNAINGRYYADHDPQNTIGHYSSFRQIDVADLRSRYEKAVLTFADEVKRSFPVPPGVVTPDALPRFSTLRDSAPTAGGARLEDQATRVIEALNAEGCWPSRLVSTSHPYRGDGPKEVVPGDYSRTQVGDDYDTSPYRSAQPTIGISTSTYIANMGVLIRFMESQR